MEGVEDEGKLVVGVREEGSDVDNVGDDNGGFPLTGDGVDTVGIEEGKGVGKGVGVLVGGPALGPAGCILIIYVLNFLKFKVPRPVEGSQPGVASYPWGQQVW